MTTAPLARTLLVCCVCSCAASLSAQEQSVSAARDEGGVRVHAVVSPYQRGETQIRVLPPDKVNDNQRLTAIYLLPVEAARESRYGDSLAEVQRLDLHNKLPAIFVAPTFSQLPWYADHPTDPAIRQESYFVHVVVPFVDKNYPVENKPSGRMLLGFSKSGWGAWSLLLRHPATFGKAAAWDAPLAMREIGKYGTTGIMGTPENFENYRIDKLLRQAAVEANATARLGLFGYGNFRDEHVRTHELLDELKVPHHYVDGPQRKHDWHSGWVQEAATWLVK